VTRTQDKVITERQIGSKYLGNVGKFKDLRKKNTNQKSKFFSPRD
jgi:hypothetical protein